MSTYDLTETQKELLRAIVESDDAGDTVEKGILLINYGGGMYDLWGPKMKLDSLADLDALCDEGLLQKISWGSTLKYRIKNAAHTAIAANFTRPQEQSEARLAIGAIIGSVSGGNVQAIGHAINSEISQIVNDPTLFQAYLEQIADNLLNEVKAELSVREYSKYQEAVESLKKQLLEEKPSESAVKKMIQSISFLGDIEGSVGLMLRVWSLIQPFVTILALKLANAA
jgi:hypothetical protein